MKRVGIVLLIIFFNLAVVSLPLAGSSNPAGQTGKVPLAVQNFENKNGPALSSRWDFLKQTEGPSNDPVSNGLMNRLEKALAETGGFVVAAKGMGTSEGPLSRGFPPEETPGSASPTPLDTLRFIVSGDLIFSGDHVTIVVRLFDSQTKKLVKVTTVEGRPEDLQKLPPSALANEESPEKRAVRAAIEKVVASIQGALLEWVTVKAVATKVRQEPSLQSAPLATVRQGEKLKKVEQEGDWVRVQLKNGETGWVPGELVELTE